MDDIKRPQPKRHAPVHRRRYLALSQQRRAPETKSTRRTARQVGTLAVARSQQRQKQTVRLTVRIPHFSRFSRIIPPSVRGFYEQHKFARMGTVTVALIVVIAEVLTMLQPFAVQQVYALGTAESLLSPINPYMAQKLSYSGNDQAFLFNKGYSPNSTNLLGATGSQASAAASIDASKGITVSDPVNRLDITSAPQFALRSGKKFGNRVVYPLADGSGWAVYTMHSIGVKEDIVLRWSRDDVRSFKFNLVLPLGVEARMEPNGSVGIYGNTMLSGNVATGSQKDAALLQKARQKAPKNTLLFTIPPPVVQESGRTGSNVRAAYSLSGKQLQVNVKGLSKATYPLTIDPSIYVETAEKFMYGNNETNIDFDVADTLIQKGKTTGARFDTWSSTMNLNSALWQQGVAAAGGYIYTAGGIQPNGSITTYTTPGSDTYIVPAGITSLTVKMWGGGGGGGGGGAGGASNVGGDGGGAGFAQATLSVTPGATLSIRVGGGGGFGSGGSTNSGDGGGGGGYSAVLNGGTPLIIASGGGGGGGGANTGGQAGASGAPGGGSTGGTGGTAGSGAGGGGGGTQLAGGAGGTGGTNSGSAGSSLTGGAGADGRSGQGADGSAANGGTIGGGSGGSVINNNYSGGGGGGGGYYGGGGGSATATSGLFGITHSGGGGGGGGSGYVTGTSTSNTAGTGSTPGNSTDTDIGSAGQGGIGGAQSSNGSAGTAGKVIVTAIGGSTSSSTVNWAKFSTTDGTIGSANPGNGTCSGWCTASAYDLPAARSAFSLVAYNGFLYAIGGEDSSCTTGNGTGDGGVCKTVYVAKLGANGEPRLWHPTDPDKNNWNYWYRAGDLSSPRSFAGAVAYNNHLYLMGGKTSSGGTPSVVSTVEVADIIPTGALSSWSTTGMVTLRDPTNNASTLARYGFGAQAYNDRLYVIGGASSIGGSPRSSSQYIKLKSDGTMDGNWQTTTSLSAGRFANGGNLTAVWGAYMYVSGGCGAVNASGYCTSVASDTQLASINADGSLDVWNTNASVSDTRMGHGLVAWRNAIYEIGGCSSQDGATGGCAGGLNTINYGDINPDGDASTVSQSVASGTAPCSGASPYNCNLPSTIGNVLNETAIMNGYLYIMGGCSNNACSTVSNVITYQAIGSDGSLQKPAACSGSYTDSYCVSSTNLPSGLAAAGTAVFGGRIYLVGGFNTGTRISYTTVNSDGSIGAWTNTSLNGITTPTITTLTYSYAYARANPSSAGSNPGNLYIFGGCTDGSVGCSGYSGAVYKCNLATSGAPSGCTTSGQEQIGTLPAQDVNGTMTNPTGAGLGAAAGAVYANYIYLIGGLAPGITDMKTVRYAKFDNSNNVVSVTSSGWEEGANQTSTGRRRGAGFGYNGYLYVVGGYDGTGGGGVLEDIEFAKIDVSDGSWGAFTTSSVTINQRWGLTVPVSNSYAYVVGGCTAGAAPSSCTSRTSTVQTFQIYNNDSGAPAGYSATATCGTVGPCSGASGGVDRIGGSSTVLNGYIYYAGGCTDMACVTTTNATYYAPLNSDGTIGTWSSGGNLPSTVAWGKLVTAGGTLYYVGGQTGTLTATASSAVYYTSAISSGSPTWGTASNGIPAVRTQPGVAVWNDRIYVVGGYNGSGTAQSTVYRSPQLSSGGNITSSWPAATTSFNVARGGATAITYANNLYILGGYDGTNYLSDTQYAQISTSDGSVGSWTYSTNLPTALSQADGFAVNGYMYLFGGRSASTTCRPITLVSPISANTTIASGNNPTGVGEWYETNQKYTGDRYGAAAAYNDGKAYVIGGGCSSFVGTANRTYQTTLLSQPQVAKYSIMFDTDTDVYPKKWLLNGLDNSVGAYWQLSYRSMTNPGATIQCAASTMSTWGQTTNVGNVTLGSPGTYTAKDGSGTNTNCARYFYISLTIDSSKAFGYPEDVSRGPTITDLTLEFTADPSKRLMHGRTFTGGLQQPDDTPF